MASFTDKHYLAEESMEEEYLPFISNEKTTIEQSEEQMQQREALPSQDRQMKTSRSHSWFWPVAFLAQTTAFVLALAILWTKSSTNLSTNYENHYMEKAFESTLYSAIDYKISFADEEYWSNDTYCKFDEQSDRAWGQFRNGAKVIRISQEDLSVLNVSESLWRGQKLSDGGYPGTLAVFHNLHCIRYITRMVNVLSKNTDGNTDMSEFPQHHVYHCLNVLRLSLMCSPELTHLPLIWSDKESGMIVVPAVPRRCVDWDSLMHALKDRQYDYVEEIVPEKFKEQMRKQENAYKRYGSS